MKNIDTLFQQTHDEYVRTRYIATLHNHIMMNVRFNLRDIYEKSVQPESECILDYSPNSIHQLSKEIEKEIYYRTYSSIRYNTQEMLSQSKVSAVERKLPEMIEAAREIANKNPAGGSLQIDPDLELPKYITALDVHLIPGGYHSEHTQDDVAQGVLLGVKHSGPVINPGRDFGNVGYSVSTWLKHTYPNFMPNSVLDMGTQGGSNLIAYGKEFPGIELYGIDIAAPGLRYGHAKAELQGVKMHLSQQNAEKVDFADEAFDLVVSSFFFHEIPFSASKRIFSEAFRVLRPGGMMVNLELPPHKSCENFINFMYDWDTRHNNEPNYRNFRSQDPTQLLVTAGFLESAAFETTIPEVATFDMNQYRDVVEGRSESPPHGRGGWFIFGSCKPS